MAGQATASLSAKQNWISEDRATPECNKFSRNLVAAKTGGSNEFLNTNAKFGNRRERGPPSGG